MINISYYLLSNKRSIIGSNLLNKHENKNYLMIRMESHDVIHA